MTLLEIPFILEHPSSTRSSKCHTTPPGPRDPPAPWLPGPFDPTAARRRATGLGTNCDRQMAFVENQDTKRLTDLEGEVPWWAGQARIPFAGTPEAGENSSVDRLTCLISA